MRIIWIPALCILAVAEMQSARADVPVAQTFSDSNDADQDDMCFWVHPDDPSQSTLITSDKGNGKIFVYDLNGTVIQTIQASMPGNIDIRYGFQLGQDCADLVAFNDRVDLLIRVYRVDPVTRQLERVDDENIVTGDNYGFTLYRHTDGRLFAYTGPKESALIRQWQLTDNGTGQVSGQATAWEFDESTVEGMVGDDESGYIYLGEESTGIWKVGALDHTDKTLIASVGDQSGLAADVEGLTIYYAADGAGYIIASSQGADKFTILERQPPHLPAGEFQIAELGSTDGIDVLNLGLNQTYTQGIFAAHNGNNCCPVQTVKWEDIASEVGGLIIDTTYWDPRLSIHCEGPEDPDGGPPDAGPTEDAGPGDDSGPGDAPDGTADADGTDADGTAQDADAATIEDAGQVDDQDEESQHQSDDDSPIYGDDQQHCDGPVEHTTSDCSCQANGQGRASIILLASLFLGLFVSRKKQI